jgi:hypothetical protein
MKRRLVLTLCLLGVIGGGAGAAMAVPTSSTTKVCVVTSADPGHTRNTYYCVSLPGTGN